LTVVGLKCGTKRGKVVIFDITADHFEDDGIVAWQPLPNV
jgi:hypothetical protein